MLPKKEVKGEHVYITGAGSGIGRTMAIKLAEMGARISCVDLDGAAANETAREITSAGGDAIGLQCDVTSSSDVTHSGTEARMKYGPVTILINNAGIVSGKKILDNKEQTI